MATKMVEASKEELKARLKRYLIEQPLDASVSFFDIERNFRMAFIEVCPGEILEIIKPLVFGKERVAKFGISFKGLGTEDGKLLFQIIKLADNFKDEPNSYPQVSVIGLEDKIEDFPSQEEEKDGTAH